MMRRSLQNGAKTIQISSKLYFRCGERIAALSLVVTMLFLVTIGKENRVLESYAENDDDSPVDESANGDEDDEKDLNFPFSEETASYATITLSATKNRNKCNDDQIMVYLSQLQVINPETIVQIASYKDVAHICRKVGTTLESIDALMQTCNPPPQTNLYMQLTTGVRVLHNKLCTQSAYQLAFTKYMACYQELHNEYIDCAGPADWTEFMEDQELCNQYKVITDCYYTQTAMLCGLKAAKTFKELVIRVFNAVIETRCPEVRKNPLVPDPMPEHGIYTRKSNSSKIVTDFRLYVMLFTIYIFAIGD